MDLCLVSFITIPYHVAPEFALVITADVSGTVEVEPALLALPDPQDGLVNLAHLVHADVP